MLEPPKKVQKTSNDENPNEGIASKYDKLM